MVPGDPVSPTRASPDEIDYWGEDSTEEYWWVLSLLAIKEKVASYEYQAEDGILTEEKTVLMSTRDKEASYENLASWHMMAIEEKLALYEYRGEDGILTEEKTLMSTRDKLASYEHSAQVGMIAFEEKLP